MCREHTRNESSGSAWNIIPKFVALGPNLAEMAKKMSYKNSKTARFPYIIYPGILLLIGGLCLLFLWPSVHAYIVHTKLQLAKDSEVYHNWKRTKIPSEFQVFFHNWTNPEDIHNATIKPKFQEVGPFTFRETKIKVNVTWNENNTVSYRQKKLWHFDEAASCCSLSTNITTLNAIIVTMSQKVQNWNILLKLFISTPTLKALSPDVHVSKTAGELLYDGYMDDMLGVKFGWFHGKNDSSRPEGLINMDITPGNQGEVRRWNTWDKTPYYGDKCNEVHGSASELYPTRLNKISTSLFSADLCRNIPLDYERDAMVEGLNGYKYIAHKRLLDNGTLFPENKCYCNGECMPVGVLNISTCRMGSPSFVSLPHFLYADPIYSQKIEGMKPDINKHQFYKVIEPLSGIPIDVSARLQLNMFLKPVRFVTVIDDVPTLMFPILWFQLKTRATPELADKLKTLHRIPSYIKGVALSAIIISLILIALGICSKKKRKEKSEPIIRESVPLQSKVDF